MKFTTTAFSALLAAEAVYAGPVTLVPRASRSSKRSGVARSSRPNQVINGPDASNVSNVAYSSNWAGAVLDGSDFTSVTGTFVVPTPSEPSGGSSSKEYSAAIWVGLDGSSCDTTILQTGIDVNIQGGEVSFDAWYEWYPDYSYNFDGFGISAGDSIKLTATASSTTGGKVIVDNLSTGKSVTHSFSGESAALCETNAEWIVEDFEEGSSLVPFADFGKVTFTDCSVTSSGKSLGVTGSTVNDIKQSGKVLTSCSFGASTVTCSYV
ncbi:acid proteinase [Grosmannia clavigera kw1407]|uniref:Acid proteinase n=1 Tax=Grosmannia clavigera (strain kw1407 / UAMH 11150) TaxID=655863 RepID=F0XIJ2_GROCL|nr:acid proteinase [Grosmannia clavigera kw1407]EFX02566.1 acid proteinase [Grosmannia clavigera kw1407]